MDYSPVLSDLKSRFPDIKIEGRHPLAPYTTLKIGGPCDIFIHTTNNFQFKSVLKHIHQLRSTHPNLPLTVLGNGSNILISDTGLPGIVIKNTSQKIDILDSAHQSSAAPLQASISTHRTENEPDKYLDFNSLDYDESDSPTVKVKLTSGTPLPFAINYLIGQGVTGLQWFAYIPGTIGGAVWYNIHGGKYHFSDYISQITAFNLNTGLVEKFKKSDLDWNYDQSHFQQNPHLIILTVTLRLYRGDAQKAKAVVNAWIGQKVKVQPMNSAGSVFKNPKLTDCQKIWGEQKSTGWIIDHELNLKGTTVGGAQISPKHANFIINNGTATAADYKALVDLVQSQVRTRFGFDLEPEVKFLGQFSD